MKHNEYVIALVEPHQDGEAPLDIAKDVAARGGRASVYVLATERAKRDIRAFSDSEELSLGRAGAIYADRVSEKYSTAVGGPATATHFTETLTSGRQLLDLAMTTGATMIAVPQHLMEKRQWRKPLGRSHIPVVIAPRRRAASATPCAWLPADEQMTPLPSSSSVSCAILL